MEPNAPDPVATAPAAAPAPAVEHVPPSAPGPDLAYVAQLEEYARRTSQQLAQLEPLKDELSWMLEDPSRVDGVRRYRQAYEQAGKPQIDPQFEPVTKYIDEKFEPVRAYITRQEEAEKNRLAGERRKFEADNIAFAQRLQSKEKLSSDQLQTIAAFADSKAARSGRNVTIEEAYNDMKSFGGTRTPEAAAPVLRADSATPGVPGPSTGDGVRWKTDFHGALVDSIKAAQKAS